MEAPADAIATLGLESKLEGPSPDLGRFQSALGDELVRALKDRETLELAADTVVQMARGYQDLAERYGKTGAVEPSEDAPATLVEETNELGQLIKKLRAANTRLNKKKRTSVVEVSWDCDRRTETVHLRNSSTQLELDIAALRAARAVAQRLSPDDCPPGGKRITQWELSETLEWEDLPVRAFANQARGDNKQTGMIGASVGFNLDPVLGQVEARSVPRRTQNVRFLGARTQLPR